MKTESEEEEVDEKIFISGYKNYDEALKQVVKEVEDYEAQGYN